MVERKGHCINFMQNLWVNPKHSKVVMLLWRRVSKLNRRIFVRNLNGLMQLSRFGACLCAFVGLPDFRPLAIGITRCNEIVNLTVQR